MIKSNRVSGQWDVIFRVQLNRVSNRAIKCPIVLGSCLIFETMDLSYKMPIHLENLKILCVQKHKKHSGNSRGKWKREAKRNVKRETKSIREMERVRDGCKMSRREDLRERSENDRGDSTGERQTDCNPRVGFGLRGNDFLTQGDEVPID